MEHPNLCDLRELAIQEALEMGFEDVELDYLRTELFPDGEYRVLAIECRTFPESKP